MLKLLLLLNPIYVTLFWFLVLISNNRKSNTPKTYLGKFMGIASLVYISHLLYYLPLPNLYHFVDAFYQLFSLLLFPMYFVYIRLLTIDHSFSIKKHGLFFIAPIVLFLFYVVGVLNMSKEEHINYLYSLLIRKEPLSGIFYYQKIIYIICRLTFVVEGLLYMFLSVKLVRSNKDTLHNYYANTDEDRLDKINWLNVTLLITIIGGIVLSILGRENFVSDDKKLIYPSVFFSLLLFIIGWLGNKQRPVLTETSQENEKSVIEKDEDEVSNFQLEIIKKKIEQLFGDEKIYLNKDLTIWEVARIIGTNRTYVSLVINNDFKQNFSGYVNSYRAKYAKNLLNKNPNISKEDLSEMSGFGSVSSMKRAFGNLYEQKNKKFTPN